MLGTLDKPTEGSVHFRGRNLAFLKDDELSQFRNQTMGFVFQFHHLLADFTAQENVAMPLFVAGVDREESMQKASVILGELGLGHRLGHRSSKLSGGEQQRVAIARAIVRNPAVVFADEPTGNLDRVSGQQIQNLLFDLQQSHKLTLVVVTHDQQFATRFQRTLTLADGMLTSGSTASARTL
jgi:lipoprotein-releasing system ATP-binding protein